MNDYADIARSLMLDANAIAGTLWEIFTAEMTVTPVECAHCGREGPVGSLLAFVHGPGVVLRCPWCESIVLRFATTPSRMYLDARGAAHLCVPLKVQ